MTTPIKIKSKSRKKKQSRARRATTSSTSWSLLFGRQDCADCWEQGHVSGVVLIFVIIAAHTLFTWYQIVQHDAALATSVSSAWSTLQRGHAPDQHVSFDHQVPPDSGDSSSSFYFYDFAKDPSLSSQSDGKHPVVIFYNIYLPPDDDEKTPFQGKSQSTLQPSGTTHPVGNVTTMRTVQENASSANGENDLILDAPSIFRSQMAQVTRYQQNQNTNVQTGGGGRGAAKIKVYYNTIGQDMGTIGQDICEKHHLDCTHMHHYDHGHEDVTLQNLYDYCHSAEPTARVAYLHAKGSFHPTVYNNKNRVTVTFSVLNKCLDALGTTTTSMSTTNTSISTTNDTKTTTSTTTTTTCDACGGMFVPIWGPFFSTNMWSAQCSYIRKLLPPREFARRMETLNQTLRGDGTSPDSNLKGRRTNVTASNATPSIALETALPMTKPAFRFDLIENIGPYCMGTGRYSYEHWIASHPSLRPCDARGVRQGAPAAPRAPLADSIPQWKLLDGRRIRHVVTSPPKPEVNNSQQGGRGDYQKRLARWRRNEREHQEERLQEYFLLGGYLFRSIFLYRTVPPPDSWVWSFFPDGVFWKEQTDRHGLEVVSKVFNMTKYGSAIK